MGHVFYIGKPIAASFQPTACRVQPQTFSHWLTTGNWQLMEGRPVKSDGSPTTHANRTALINSDYQPWKRSNFGNPFVRLQFNNPHFPGMI
jgi:hypothetical protein